MKNGFKVIPGYERYAIDKGGVVYDTETGQYMIPARDEKGDKFVRLEVHGRGQKRLVEPLIAKAFDVGDRDGSPPAE